MSEPQLAGKVSTDTGHTNTGATVDSSSMTSTKPSEQDVLKDKPSTYKKLIAMFDGTWQDATRKDERRSNMALLEIGIATSDRQGHSQIVHYFPGVGTRAGNLREKLLGGGIGYNWEQDVKRGIRFFSANYKRGDAMFAGGFSRGASIARVLGNFIRDTGVLTKIALPYIDFIFNDWLHSTNVKWSKKDKNGDKPFGSESLRKQKESNLRHLARTTCARLHVHMHDDRETYREGEQPKGLRLERDPERRSRKPYGDWASYVKMLVKEEFTMTTENKKTPIRLECIFAFDTVSATSVPTLGERYGIPIINRPSLANKSTSDPRFAFHLLSIDEERKIFSPLVWQKDKTNLCENDMHLRQEFLAGGHTDIGGGGETTQQSNVALIRMCDHLQSIGLELKDGFIHMLWRQSHPECATTTQASKENNKKEVTLQYFEGPIRSEWHRRATPFWLLATEKEERNIGHFLRAAQDGETSDKTVPPDRTYERVHPSVYDRMQSRKNLAVGGKQRYKPKGGLSLATRETVLRADARDNAENSIKYQAIIQFDTQWAGKGTPAPTVNPETIASWSMKIAGQDKPLVLYEEDVGPYERLYRQLDDYDFRIRSFKELVVRKHVAESVSDEFRDSPNSKSSRQVRRMSPTLPPVEEDAKHIEV